MSWWKGALSSFALGVAAMTARNIDMATKGQLIEAARLFGGVGLCLLALATIIRHLVTDWSAPAYRGRYVELYLLMAIGPLFGLILMNMTATRLQFETAAMFGWGYGPSVLAAWCLANQQNKWARFYFIGYTGITSVYLTAFLIGRLMRSDMVFFWLVGAAIVVLIGGWCIRQDEQHQQAVAARPPADPVQPEDGATTGSNRSQPGLAPDLGTAPAAAYTPAPTSLADDFDVPPQR